MPYHDDDSNEDSKESPTAKSSKDKKFAHGTPWWGCPLEPTDGEPQPHEILDRLYEEVERDQQGRYEAYREYERIFGADSVQAGTDEAINMLITGELKQNELANTLETLHAQVFKDKVVPSVATSEADSEEWVRA